MRPWRQRQTGRSRADWARQRFASILDVRPGVGRIRGILGRGPGRVKEPSPRAVYQWLTHDPSSLAPRLPHWPGAAVRARSRSSPVPPGAMAATRKETAMLWTIFVILLVLWVLGIVSSYTLGGFIHILLVIALAVILIRVIQGRRPI